MGGLDRLQVDAVLNSKTPVEPEKDVKPQPVACTGSKSKPVDGVQTMFEIKRAAKYDTDVMEGMIQCVRGNCKVDISHEAHCRDCGRGMHSSCSGLAKANLALGVFLCGDCQMKGMQNKTEMSESQSAYMRRESWNLCKAELTAFAVGTYEGSRLMDAHIKEWQSMAGSISDPRANLVALKLFLRWYAVDKHKSLKTAERTLARQMKDLKFPPLMSDSTVKLVLVELRKGYGDDVQRDSALPIEHLIKAVDILTAGPSEKNLTGQKNAVRDVLTIMLEFFLGLRIGETTGHGHGVEANNVLVFQDAVELTLTSRKTCNHSITITASRINECGLDLGQVLLDYFMMWNVPTVMMNAGKVDEYTRPNYFVVRLDVNGCVREDFPQVAKSKHSPDGSDGRCELELWLSNHHYPELNANAKELTRRCRERCKNQDIDARFVNVFGGTESACDAMVQVLLLKGFKALTANGPLVRPSSGRYPLHQPASVGNMSQVVTSAFRDAHEYMAAKGVVVPDVPPGGMPKWGTHSARRGGAKRAMDTRSISKVSALSIDFHFGWDEQAHSKEHTMQWMYAGIAHRSERIMVTRYF